MTDTKTDPTAAPAPAMAAPAIAETRPRVSKALCIVIGTGPRFGTDPRFEGHENRRPLGRMQGPYPTFTDMPPSTGSAAPVMKFASSEARNSAALAMSRDTVTRRSAISSTYS